MVLGGMMSMYRNLNYDGMGSGLLVLMGFTPGEKEGRRDGMDPWTARGQARCKMGRWVWLQWI